MLRLLNAAICRACVRHRTGFCGGRHRTVSWLVVALGSLLLAGPASCLADTIRLLDDHAEALRSRVDLIRQAQHTIGLSTFIIESDQIGLGLVAELRGASRRGVEVRLLLDAGYNRLDRRVIGHLLEEGVEVREYHRFRPTKPLWITRRMHDKLLLVDGREMVTGGRNVSNPYFGIGAKTYLDLDIYVRGEAAASAAHYFDQLFESEHVAPKLGPYLPERWAVRCTERPQRRPCKRRRRGVEEGLAWAARRLDEALVELAELELSGDADNWLEGARDVGDVRFVFDAIGAKASRPGVAHALRDLFARAKQQVLIESPYLVPSRAFRRALVASHARGVEVRILTNSLNTTDNLWPQAGYVGDKRWLQHHGVELWELIGRDTLHSKSAVIDGKTVVVASFNLDPRSEKLNREVMVFFEDAQTATELDESMRDRLESAWRIGSDGRPEGYQERYPGIGWWKLCKLRILRLVTPFLRKQL